MDVLEGARQAYARRDWPLAYRGFKAASENQDLAADDLYALSDAAWWMGRMEDCLSAGAEAYRAYIADGQLRPAAMTALGVAVTLATRGDEEGGADWIGRCAGLLAGVPEGVEHGFLLALTSVLGPLDVISPADESAVRDLLASARRVQDLGRAHDEPTLVALGLLGEGRALTKTGKAEDGAALLDEVMGTLRSHVLLPEWTGELYCQLMASAHEVYDLRRLQRLTGLTTRWLERLPAAALFWGLCRVHRCQLRLMQGDWAAAEADAIEACIGLLDIGLAAAAEAQYQLGEVRRLRGDLAGAEGAYREAHRLGRNPQPGLALARLAEGKVKAALASVATALLAEPGDRLRRARLRAAQVEIAIAAGDADLAAEACSELEDIAAAYGTNGLEVMARRARGWWLLAAGRREEALPVLRHACHQWQELGAPYECARTRVLLARAYQALGDGETAALERHAASAAFEELGATPDLRALDEFDAGRQLPDALTPREAEVLGQLARGHSNRQIAGALFISEKTVARHLSNIFTKLGVSSRAAAAAYAVEHDLGVRPTG